MTEMLSFVVKFKFSAIASKSAVVKMSEVPTVTTSTSLVEINVSGVVVANALVKVIVRTAMIVIRFFIIIVCTYKTGIQGLTLIPPYYREGTIVYKGTTGYDYSYRSDVGFTNCLPTVLLRLITNEFGSKNHLILRIGFIQREQSVEKGSNIIKTVSTSFIL